MYVCRYQDYYQVKITEIQFFELKFWFDRKQVYCYQKLINQIFIDAPHSYQRV